MYTWHGNHITISHETNKLQKQIFHILTLIPHTISHGSHDGIIGRKLCEMYEGLCDTVFLHVL